MRLGSFFVLVSCRRRSSAEDLSLAIAIEVPIFLCFFILDRRNRAAHQPHVVVLIVFTNGEMLLCSRSDPIGFSLSTEIHRNFCQGCLVSLTFGKKVVIVHFGF